MLIETIDEKGRAVHPIATTTCQLRALSVRQPHASRIERGIKRVEFRTWKTDYRGPLVICAGSQRAKDYRPMNHEHEEPLGCIVARCELFDVCPATLADIEPGCASALYAEEIAAQVEHERTTGKLPKIVLYAWHLRDAVSVAQVPFKGRLQLFSIGADARVTVNEVCAALWIETLAARAWADANLRDRLESSAGGIAIEFDYLADILNGMRKDGLLV